MAGQAFDGILVSRNIVEVSGTAQVSSTIYGGYSSGYSSSAQVTNNSVRISGGTVTGDIYGGWSKYADVTGNAVHIHAAADVSQSTIRGGGGGGDTWTGNVLNLYGEGIVAKGVENFETYNFYLSDAGSNGDTLLTVSGATTTDLNGAKINVGLAGTSSALVEGDSLILLDASAGGIIGTPTTGSGMQGVTQEFVLSLEVLNDQLLGTITGVRVADQSKALSEGALTGLALANQGADMAAGEGMREAVAAATRGGNTTADGWAGFSAMGGGHLRYATGSHVSMDSFSLIAGVAKEMAVGTGRLNVGAFFEYGHGSYDSYNDFGSSTVNGSGSADYYGGGLLARLAFAPTGPGSFYAEASVRGGVTDNDFGSANMAGFAGTWTGYDYSTGYYGMHAGAGFSWDVNEALSLDTNGKFLWTRQGGEEVTLTSGDKVDFADADSLRLRLGLRANYALSAMFTVHGGLGWEYEFDGDANASTGGYSIVAPSMGGGTGFGELGVTVRPFADGAAANLTFGLGVQGYVGTRQGVAGSGQVRYQF